MAKESILIVEDEQLIAFIIQKRLIQYGYDVAGLATSGKEAIEKAKDLKPDLVLMDIHLKDKIDGIQAALEIKKFTDIPIIYLTAFSDADTLDRAKSTAPSGFLVKPIDERELYTNVALSLHKYQLNKKLKHSEEKYRRIVEHSDDGIFLSNEAGNLIEWNKALEKITGLTTSEVLGKSLWEVHLSTAIGFGESGISLDKIKGSISEILETGIFDKGTEKYLNYRIVSKNGEIKDLQTRIYPIKTEKGYMIGGISRDITSVKKSEEALNQSEQLKKALFDGCIDPIIITDLQDRCISVNKAVEKVFGYRVDELIGKTFPGHLGLDNGKFEQWLNLCKCGEGISNYETLRRAKSGEIIPVSISISPICNSMGELVNMSFWYRDIAIQKDAEEKIRQSEKKYRELFENAHEAILIIDPLDEKILEANSQALKMYDYTKEELLNLYLTSISKNPVYGRQKLNETIKKGDFLSFETTQYSKDGSEINLMVNASIIDYHGRKAILALNRDITERKRSEEVVKEKERHFRMLYENAPLGYQSLDIDGCFIDVNQKWLETLGYSKQEVIGRWFGDFMVPESADKVKINFPKFRALGQISGIEFEMIRKNGEHIIASFEGRVSYDENGHFIQTHCIMIDITKNKLYANELRKLSIVVEQSPVSIVITDTNGNIEYVNPKFSEVSGYSSNEVLGKNPRFLKSGDILPKEYEEMWKTISAGQEWRGEFCNKKKNNELFWEKATIAPIKNHDGQITHYVALKEETTGVKIVEKYLIESEDRYRRLVEMSPDMIAMHSEGKVVYVNEAAVKYMKAESKEDLLGKSAMSFVYKDSAEVIQKRIKHMQEKRTVVPLIEEKFVDLKGNVIDVETVAVPTTYKGKPAVQVIVRDITQRIEAERALRVSEERFRTIFENSPIGITISMNDVILRANKAYVKMFGFEDEIEIISSSVLNRIAPEYKDIVIERSRKRSDSEELPVHYEAYGLRKDGTRFPVHVEIAHMNLTEGLVSMALISDITELKSREEQIKTSLKEKEILLKEIHHRVKNNLQIISSLLSLQSEYIDDQKSLILFNDSRNRVKSMALIHERLYQSSDLGRIDFSEYINELAGFLYRSYLSASKLVEIKVNAENIYLTIDTAIPCGLLINELISNSLKYAFPNVSEGIVNVTFRIDPIVKEYILIISDDGIGLPVDIDFKETVSLGFQLVNSLVDQLKGTIELNNDHPGVEFIIKFPAK